MNFSIFTYYEILSGLRYLDAQQQLAKFQQFVLLNRMLSLTRQSVDIAADIYANLRSQGNLIEDVDLLIASADGEELYADGAPDDPLRYYWRSLDLSTQTCQP